MITNTACDSISPGRVYASIGIIAWNEEEAIGPALGSVFQQSLFSELARRGLRCEVICIPNGCTDRTAEVAQELFAQQARVHPEADAFECRVVPTSERGKINSWNRFVHSLSDPQAQFLFLMDADILIHNRETLGSMLITLEEHPEANVSVDRPCKDIESRKRKSFFERASLAASHLTQAGEAQLCAQLYCIRSEIARNIYLPKDLTACDDGFIKTLVCTDFLTRSLCPERIRVADDAAHTFEAYTSPTAILRNQKRQIIGQTIVHLLVDRYLKALPEWQRVRLAETLKEKEQADPDWLRRLIAEHLQGTKHFWQLYPGLLTRRFQRLSRLAPFKKALCFPVAAAGFLINLVAGFLAYQFLKSGSTTYWPRAKRSGFTALGAESGPQLSPAIHSRR